MLWKRLNTEMFLYTEFYPKKQKPPLKFFWGVSCFLEEFLFFSICFPDIFRSDFGLYGYYIFEDFPICLIPFSIFGPVSKFQKKLLILSFLIGFLFFWVRFQFSEKILNSYYVDRFFIFLGPFPLFWGPFPVFRKSY